MRGINIKIAIITIRFSYFLWFVCGVTAFAEPRLQDTGEKTVIVIDPGHGGVNEGTIAGEYPEKIMTLISAQAMYEELIQFDYVEVHMTRTADRDFYSVFTIMLPNTIPCSVQRSGYPVNPLIMLTDISLVISKCRKCRI